MEVVLTKIILHTARRYGYVEHLSEEELPLSTIRPVTSVAMLKGRQR